MSLDLNKVADVLTKAAEFIDEIESSKLAEVKQARTKVATSIAEQLSNLTGEKLDPEKLANLDSEVIGLLQKVASTESVESLGGPRQNEGIEKKASTSGMRPEDARFLTFCLEE